MKSQKAAVGNEYYMKSSPYFFGKHGYLVLIMMDTWVRI